MSDPLAGLPVVWQGAVNFWECDQMEHMNVRFYLEKLEEGVAGFGRILGLEPGQVPRAERLNVRYLREAPLGVPMALRMGVAGGEPGRLTLAASLNPPEGGSPFATFRVAVGSPAAVEPAGAPAVPDTPLLAPRDIPFDASAPEAPADFVAAGYRRTAAGVLGARATDAVGAMCVAHAMARVSDGMALLMAEPRQTVAENATAQPGRVGGAMVEARFDRLAPTEQGMRIELWGGVVGAGGKILRTAHWLVDPDRHRVVAVVRAVSVVFDLDARAAVEITPEAQAALAPVLAQPLRPS